MSADNVKREMNFIKYVHFLTRNREAIRGNVQDPNARFDTSSKINVIKNKENNK